MQSVRPKVLIVDDDPSHLEIYGLLVRQAGFDAVPALVRFSGPDYPGECDIQLVLLDYKLDCVKTTVEIAEEVRSQYPTAPILLLSDVWSLPPEMIPYVAEFVRKGEPAKLTNTLRRMLSPRRPRPELLAARVGPWSVAGNQIGACRFYLWLELNSASPADRSHPPHGTCKTCHRFGHRLCCCACAGSLRE